MRIKINWNNTNIKKILVLPVIIIFSSQFIYSQKWLDVGAKGGYGLNLLYNQNFFNDRNFTPDLSYGYMFGGKIGLNFNDEHEVTLDITSSAFNQSFTYGILNPDSTRSKYTRGIGYNSLNFLPMYRKAKAASYFEVGPQYSIVQKTRGSDSFTGEKNKDISSNLVKSYYSVVVGFGSFIVGSENFGITLGFRFCYTLNDIISNEGKQINFPSITKYNSYQPSNPLSAMLVMEFNYDLGYLASAKCGKKTKFLMF